MSSQNLIKRIQEESIAEITRIHHQANHQAEQIVSEARALAKQAASQILERGKQQSDNVKKILISKAHQEVNRALMNAKDALIDDCFQQALKNLADLNSVQYRKIATHLLKYGSERIQNPGSVRISRDEDKELAQNKGLAVMGLQQTIGGMVIISKDGKLSIDNTFEGILQRKKHEIRTEVGKLLFTQ
ncbi:MAG: V-type ATP synthase subunit E [Candidatus Thermoplasmatota archaeon]|nr:V-type ATP synthase subunit E [Candidatus Thermoplasmatota archaeon]